ncbi:hypothetical protein ACFWOS_21215 [Streptomyces rubiginosohelvolus]|uniref:hypothetical protein n=2 Tax=Streptomyces TaxID=1883 RepID=UPI00190C3D4D|nr:MULTISPECIES: hypothetical protein [unclassified Streptomyces]MBK3529235.1 hypothetical protein [Streptomyces sp. MBT72]MBK3535606.1 hypothetical protein [Streptomyces sp. MBT67]MBK3549469.1 hypothetical protein [Streptomyces sp. MBT61]MBK6028355.1 hypothetical protein [Streptomyces sp. MBT59]
MAAAESRSSLPFDFLRTVIAQASDDSPPTRMAVEAIRTAPPDTDRDGLAMSLLTGPLAKSAPEWLLAMAVKSDLKREPRPHMTADRMDLTRVALSHQACPDAYRAQVLQKCTEARLGALGRREAGVALIHAVVAELRRRSATDLTIAPELLKAPTPAQLVLGEHGLHEDVFVAALDCLPSGPGKHDGEEDVDAWMERHRAASDAWEIMWDGVLRAQTEHHRRLLAWSARHPAADRVLREHLLGSLPWHVEPALLEEVAVHNLKSFERAVLVTGISRSCRDGLTPAQARERYADELAAASQEERDYVERFLDEEMQSEYIQTILCRSAVDWVERAGSQTWRFLLNPGEAKRYGQAREWLASQELIATLGTRFATICLSALNLWEPEPASRYRVVRDLGWLHALLVHLPEVPEEARQKARLVVQDTGRSLSIQSGAHGYVSSHSTWEENQRAKELIATIMPLVTDPVPALPGRRAASLGDPQSIRFKQLADADEAVLVAYLDRHAGNDTLVEEALLSFAASSYRKSLTFDDVLARHSAPQQTLLGLTLHLRRRLGGGPDLRGSWAKIMLSRPECPPELLRLLPAWSALKARGPRYDTTHPAVAAYVTEALGDSDEAWQRFAASPMSHAGPGAWHRLGDLLDAAVAGTAWPTPPPAR